MSRTANRRGLLLASVLCVLALPASAAAQATRTWVSGLGDDANPCSRTAPCKTFAGAITRTAAGGEIDALDSGGFGTLTVTKSITLVGTGVNASILASGTIGVNINAGSSDVVTLRDLQINGAGTTLGTTGVNVLQVGALHLEHDSIFNFSQNGVQFDPAVGGGAFGARLYVQNTRFDDMGGDAVLAAPPTGVRATVVVTDSTIENSGCGLVASALGTGGPGCGTGTTAAGTATITSSNTSISGNSGAGVQSSGAAATNYLSSDLVTGNGIGLSRLSGGVITEIGANDSVFGNTTDGTPTAMVSTGAAGATGAPGANGANGANGVNGVNGKNGEIELITCKASTKTVIKKVHGKKKKVKVTVEKCTGKLVSGTVKFTAAARDLRHASLAHDGRTVASGTVLASGARYVGLFKVGKRVRSGRYTLTVKRGRTTTRQTVTVG